MNIPESIPSRLERGIIGTLGALLAVGIVVWAWVGSRQVMQIVFIGAGFALVLLAVLSVAAWRHGFRWFFSRRALRFYGWSGAGIVSVMVLFYAEESWRGKRAWAALQREATARGESLDLSSVAPPPVPDDENFALAPGVAELLGYAAGKARSAMARHAEDLPFYLGRERRDFPAAASWAFQQPTDLTAWQKFFRRHASTSSEPAGNMVSTAAPAPADTPRPPAAGAAPLTFPVAPDPQTPAADVLLALSRYDQPLAVLRVASRRPRTRYPLAYDEGYFGLRWPDYLYQRNLPYAAHVLGLRAVAELALDQSEPALQDTLLALRLADSLRQLPYAGPHRARAEMLMFCLQPVWEGLALHGWNEQQLAALQQQFAAMDLLAEFRLAVRGETFMVMNLADQLQAYLDGRRSPMADEMRSARGDDLWPVWLFRLFYPAGWLHQDRVWVYRFYERRADVFKSLENRDGRHLYAELRRATDPFLLVFVVPRLREAFSGTEDLALFLQTACHEATVACALERYRLAQGQYPHSLEALVPVWLKQVPTDLLSLKGAKLRYTRESNDGFVLYSIGLNRLDDHGTPGGAHTDWRGVQADFPHLGEGDWVWRLPGRP